MGVVEDVLKAMDRVPLWKRLGDVPAEVDELKARIADLEGKLNGKWPPDVCRFCGERTTRLHGTYGPNERGNMREEWLCGSCNQMEIRLVKPR